MDRIIGKLEKFNKPGPTLREAIKDLPGLEQDDGAELIERTGSQDNLFPYVTEMGANNERIIF